LTLLECSLQYTYYLQRIERCLTSHAIYRYENPYTYANAHRNRNVPESPVPIYKLLSLHDGEMLLKSPLIHPPPSERHWTMTTLIMWLAETTYVQQASCELSQGWSQFLCTLISVVRYSIDLICNIEWYQDVQPNQMSNNNNGRYLYR